MLLNISSDIKKVFKYLNFLANDILIYFDDLYPMIPFIIHNTNNIKPAISNAILKFLL
jgi:hypothetical protein